MTFTASDSEYQNTIYEIFQYYMSATSDELDQYEAILDDFISSDKIIRCTSRFMR